jgi:hypothetical protein
MLFWVNVHGSFTFGLVVFYLFLCNAIWNSYIAQQPRVLRRLLFLLFGVTIAAVITPYGPISTLKTVKLMSDSALTTINEWRAPDFHDDPFHLVMIVGVFAILAYFGIKLRGPKLLTLLLVTVFALEHNRGLVLFALVAPLVLIHPLSTNIPWAGVQGELVDPVVKFAKERTGVIAIVCGLLVVIVGVSTWTIGPTIQPPQRFKPEQAIAAVRLAGIKGNVLNSHGFGGFLIFEGIPTFVDGRVELYGNQFLQRYFDAMNLADPKEAAQILKQYDIHWALLQPKEPIAFMLKTDGWTQLYDDQSVIVLAKPQ